jgi:hypothetical protein
METVRATFTSAFPILQIIISFIDLPSPTATCATDAEWCSYLIQILNFISQHISFTYMWNSFGDGADVRYQSAEENICIYET